MLHLLDRHTAMGQAPLEALLKRGVGHRWRQGQGGLLHKKPSLTQIHCIEKGGGLLPLRFAEVIGAVIHQHELPRLHRRRREAPHHAIGRLARHWPPLRPLHKHRLVAAGIHH